MFCKIFTASLMYRSQPRHKGSSMWCV